MLGQFLHRFPFVNANECIEQQCRIVFLFRKSNLEWTDELEDVGEENETDEDIINVCASVFEMIRNGLKIGKIVGTYKGISWEKMTLKK